MAKPGMVAVAAGLLGLMCALRPVGAEEKSASALSYENPNSLSVAEILEKWREGTARLPTSGRLSFRGSQKEEVLRTQMNLTLQLDWTSRDEFQLTLAQAGPVEKLQNGTPVYLSKSPYFVPPHLRLPDSAWREIWTFSPGFVLFTNGESDTYAFDFVPSPPQSGAGPHVPRWSSRYFGLRPWDWNDRATALANSLTGPGWNGPSENWFRSWNWSIATQNAQRIVLVAPPAQASQSGYSEVRWIVERSTWTTLGVRYAEANNHQTITWMREGSAAPKPLPASLLTPSLLESGGFQNVGRFAAGSQNVDRPADALLPRNGWDW